MKTEITAILLTNCLRFVVRQKEHWWCKWHYIYDGKYPRLFTYGELVELGLMNDRAKILE